MSTFRSKRSQAYHDKRLEREANPTAGRTNKESSRIRRDCHRFNNNLAWFLEQTDNQRMPWLPHEHVVTDTDDDSILDWRAVAETYKGDGLHPDEYGQLVNMQNPAITASNRIEAVTTYSSDDTGYASNAKTYYMLRKTVHSPFPCDEWGTLPLSLHQWRIIAYNLIMSRVNWQWTEALRHYARRNNHSWWEFEPDGLVGWNLVKPKQIHLNQDTELWTGHIIYSASRTFPSNRTNQCSGGQK